MDWIVIEEIRHCRVYYMSHFIKRARSARLPHPGLFGRKSAKIIHFCPSYAKGFSFYQSELALLSCQVKTQLVTLLSSKGLSVDAKWELLQLAVHNRFSALSESHQMVILNVVSQNAAVSAYLLQAAVHKRHCVDEEVPRSSTTALSENVYVDDTRAKPVLKLSGLQEGASVEGSYQDTYVEGQGWSEKPPLASITLTYSCDLRASIVATIQMLMRLSFDQRHIDCYVSLVNQVGFAGYQERLGLYLNARILREVNVVTGLTFANLCVLVENEDFGQLSLIRQVFLFDTMSSLRVLNWPDSLEHCFALARTLLVADAQEFDALSAFIGSSSIGALRHEVCE